MYSGVLSRKRTPKLLLTSYFALVILEQWSRVTEVPEIPGSYYSSRALDQAFWSVINDNVNARDAITKWSKVADAEIARKIKEYK